MKVKMNIKVKLLIIILGLTIIPLAALTFLSSNETTDALEEQAINQLRTVREVKGDQVSTYFLDIEETIDSLSESVGISHLITSDISGNQRDFDLAKEEVTPYLEEVVQANELRNLLIINSEGIIIYDEHEEILYQQVTELESRIRDNFINGKAGTYFTDFRLKGENATGYMSHPLQRNGEFMGMIVFELTATRLNNILQFSAGLGETGETYLVGEDKLMRTDSRFAGSGELLKTEIDTKAIREGLSGREEAEIIEDYRGVEVYSAYKPLSFLDENWVVVAEIDVAEVQANAIALRNGSFLLVGIAFVIVALITYLFANSISKPIRKMSLAASQLAMNKVDVDVKVKSRDELGDLSSAFSQMIDNIKEQGEVIKKISDGNLSFELTPKSAEDAVTNNLMNVKTKLKLFIEKINETVQEVQGGDLTERVDEEAFVGAWQSIAKRINRLSDTLLSYINAVPVVIATYDESMKLTYINPEGEKMLGKSASSIKGLTPEDLYGLGGEESPGRRALASGKETEKELSLNLIGQEVAVNYMGIPILSDQNKPIGAIEILVDQTEIKQKEKLAIKQAAYQENEINKLMDVFSSLAKGNLNVALDVAPGDEDVAEIRQSFINISKSVNRMITAIKGYIDEISRVLGQMSAKNLSVAIEKDFLGDFYQMKEAINAIVDSFNTMMSDITISADEVHAGSEQVSSASQALSQGSMEQASSIEEITASIEQITEQTRANANSALEANNLSNKAKDEAVTGNDQMAEMMEAMEAINASSSNISKIIKVIDEIAFQTNILALNAAVEAARAGEHGKGFAVVAEEVRNLAARSANAAKETTTMIENSIQKVAVGSKIAEETASYLKHIVEDVSRATDLVESIAKASTEQAAAISQVNEGINQVSSVTQNNTATAEESAAASEEMSSQARLLSEMVNEFTLKQKNQKKQRQQAVTIPEIDYEDVTIDLEDDNYGKY